jgi:hypothetical protein
MPCQAEAGALPLPSRRAHADAKRSPRPSLPGRHRRPARRSSSYHSRSSSSAQKPGPIAARTLRAPGGIALRFEARSLPALSAPTTTHVVNVVREALTNAMRHAGALSIRVETSAEPTAVIIAVEGDGCGFVPDLNISGHGLRGMRSRAAAIGASLEIRSVPGSGSVVRMRLPIAHSGATA